MSVITPDCINLNLSGNTRYSILKALAEMAFLRGFVSDKSLFLQTLLKRENLHSTGFGSGIAVPHGKNSCIKHPFVLFARKSEGVDWQAADGEPVNCWICIGVPQEGEQNQVKMIGALCRKIIHADFIHQLHTGDTHHILSQLNQTLSE